MQDLGTNAAGKVSEVGVTLGHVFAGAFIVLFATYFFLADGDVIWAWLVRIFPRAARRRADSSGRVAWASLTQFVRATVMVAATDAIGVMIGAAILQVPFVSAIGVLVFLGAFVPLIGAFVSGTVAVLVALVAQGPLTALIMFGVIVLVQQIEAHVLQPFLMGRFVSVHPLGVIVAIAMGVLVAGIAGALVAVPLAASVNAVVQHLAADTDVGEGITDDSDDEGVVGDTDVAEEAGTDATRLDRRPAGLLAPGRRRYPPDASPPSQGPSERTLPSGRGAIVSRVVVLGQPPERGRVSRVVSYAAHHGVTLTDVEAATPLLADVAIRTPMAGARVVGGPGRWAGAAQVREPPAHGVVQDPRRLRAAVPAR